VSAPAIWTVQLPDTGSCRAPDSSSTAGHNQGTTHGCGGDRGVVRTANIETKSIGHPPTEPGGDGVKIRRCLRIAAICDLDGEIDTRDVWCEVDPNTPAEVEASEHLSYPWVLAHAEWVEMPGQGSLL
jgi:hypothetical protein